MSNKINNFREDLKDLFKKHKVQIKEVNIFDKNESFLRTDSYFMINGRLDVSDTTQELIKKLSK